MYKSIGYSFLMILFVAGCGGGGGGGDDRGLDDPGSGTPRLTSLLVYDASKLRLTDADVTISDSQTSNRPGSRVAYKTSATALKTDLNGSFAIPEGLPPGIYTLKVIKEGIESTSIINIDNNLDTNTNSTSAIVPLANNNGAWSNISGTAILAAISGKVIDSTTDAPIADASVSISGGSATNGAVATAVTDSNGNYDLLINARIAFAGPLSNATISVRKTGFQEQRLTGFKLVNGINIAGLNFFLGTGSTQQTVLWQETFETDSPTASQWIVNQIAGDNINNTWNILNSGANITNEALTDGFVQLAGNDTSAGRIPDPPQGNRAYWYGSPTTADNTFVFGSVKGNFLDNQDLLLASPLDGGTSSSFDSSNSGELISPVINLTAVPSTQDVSLIFDTFWEIESVNPNASGFDLMTVEYTTDGGLTWTPQARLNPLSDPQDTLIRDPIPFSNTGYNSAPKWLTQEAIPLDGVQGKSIQIRFVFDTVDELYNGFRGWMVDNVIVQEGTGTFPVFVEGDFGNETFSYFYVAYDDVNFLPLVTPPAFDSQTLETNFLVSGSNTNFSATVNYVDDVGPGSFRLKLVDFDYVTGLPTEVAVSAITPYTQTDTISEGTANLSASFTVPNIPFVELWVEMTDNLENVTEFPVEFYEVQ